MAKLEKKFLMAEFKCDACGHNPTVTTIAYRQFEDSSCSQCGKGKLRTVALLGYRIKGKGEAA